MTKQHALSLAVPIVAAVLASCKPQVEAPKPAVPATPAIAPAMWLTGTWTGTHDGAQIEETWSLPHGPSMIGSMRVLDEGKPVFYELIVLDDQDGTAFMRLAHFKPPLQATPKGTLSYKLSSSTDRELLFELDPSLFDDVKRIRYTKNANDPNAMSVKLERDDGAEELLFTRLR